MVSRSAKAYSKWYLAVGAFFLMLIGFGIAFDAALGTTDVDWGWGIVALGVILEFVFFYYDYPGNRF